MSTENELEIIGSTEYVKIAGIDMIPAKIDTGADSSSVWASNIKMGEDGVLSFVLFDKSSPFYTGEKIETTDYMAKSIRSSLGNQQIRYRVKLPIIIGNKTLKTTFTLANRARNNFPILIGRRTLEGNYLVDVKRSMVSRKEPAHSGRLNQELKNNPYEFHQKYMKKG
ncbi:ATP-dependent zinc protease [Candidatus Saccharibacteria bacterium]|nr:ATP-dependent zinc protease [Candidatus Saccharibacteria bacterium]